MKCTTKVRPINGKRGCVERDFVLVTFMSDFFTPLMKLQIPVRRLCRVQWGSRRRRIPNNHVYRKFEILWIVMTAEIQSIISRPEDGR